LCKIESCDKVRVLLYSDHQCAQFYGASNQENISRCDVSYGENNNDMIPKGKMGHCSLNKDKLPIDYPSAVQRLANMYTMME
jgi:hypothetical protein